MQFLPGVGPKRAKAFARLGVETLGDLVRHLPFRYEYEHAESPIASLGADQLATVTGEVAATRVAGQHRGPKKARFEATLNDGSGILRLTWFNSGFLFRQIKPGHRLTVTGKTKRMGNYLQIINPKWEHEPAKPVVRTDRYRPVYHATEDLPTDRIDAIVQASLDAAIPLIEDHLDEAFRTSLALPALSEAYRLAHRPESEDDVATSRRRLAFDELFLLQVGIALRRHQLRHTAQAPVLAGGEEIGRRILERFPFALTDAQRRVIEEIRADVATPTPMNRLLQGDVGSGKTVVALYAMLLAVANKGQAALLAPTELLAEQHYLSISDMLAGSKVRLRLLTGSTPASAKSAILAETASGTVDLLIGTHALLSDRLTFANLAMVVIDEQHRFGVHQRAALRQAAEQGGAVPHTLVMTATPIPRTLSLTLLGDLDISTIDTLPPGRTPITTRVVTSEKRDVVYEYLAQRMKEGAQAYIVLPFIDEAESSDLRDLQTHMKWLEEGPFAGFHLAAVHGRLKQETRAAVMERFRLGMIHALVATSVVEVGIDVPNASLMVVEHAERFGLSQLHQLRGRIGRGSARSLCTLIADPTTDEAKRRLEVIAETTDGFRIAEADLEIRGMGNIFGAEQSGLPPFRVTELPRDLKLLELARREARTLIAADPTLADASRSLLRKRLYKAYGPGLGLADVG